MDMNGAGWNGNGGNQSYDNAQADDDNYGPINVKEDGKMFIGGLNWETTEESLKNYFTQFGEVSECTVMRDSATGRSRGFGFLTFRDPKCVNIVMVKEHYLDGKIIDPKRAIPREEQERTSKIFVGGVSQEATEDDFKNFFKQFGRVVDATLMMDKDTGRPRGFGFVTFDGDAAVDATLQGPLQILGKPIEVKRAQPRGNMRDGEDEKKFGGGRGGGKFGGRNDNGGGNGAGSFDNQPNQGGGGVGGAGGANGAGMTPAMMAQYWQRMQQYFQQMQQQLAAAQGGGMSNPMAAMGAQMNPAMMQQMMAGGMGGMGGGMNIPQTGSPAPPNAMGGMNPAMMQQMQQMQQMQMQQQQQQQQGGGNYGGGNQQQGMMGAAPRPAYTAQEQLAFEQQKYEQQQQRRMQQQAGYGGAGGPTSWEGMYDDIPQPAMPPAGPAGGRMGGGSQGSFGGGGMKGNRGRQGSSQPPAQPSNAPANAPTGPKNAGKPGANYRGGGHRGGGSYRHNPYGNRG
ncbi:RNA-binding domain-containing protein [Melanomma pulvis-pyrius CBS 109.77]|uniref:RNA-binding domain-containing protein n=1 Tax=Melanomma pulvis-pyrius CBS 109.77 TaxID=1314802 RepID=A0A6A6X5R5_9PLEO|nr:RNA-binding domain-containing protein [Melanomma pulvis-pyrius CBS 109.77]